MRKLILAFMFFFLILPIIAEEEEVVFESILKDADFRPLYTVKTPFDSLRDGDPFGWSGWWTLKFENGAVITINRSWLNLPKHDIWWIGKEYKVSKEKFCFRAKLIEKEKEKKENPRADS